MSVITPPGFLQASSYAAADLRRNSVTSLMQRSLRDLTHQGGQGGYTPGRAPAWSLSGFALTVGPFGGFVENGFATDSGEYPVFNTANQLLTFAGSSPTQGRIDLVGVQVDDAFYSGTLNDANLVIIQGTPSSGTPSPPSTPATYLPLLSASIAASSSTAILTGLRKIVPAAGGIPPMIDAQAADVGAFVGAYRSFDTGGLSGLPRNLLGGFGSDSLWHGVGRFRLPRPTPSFGATANATVAVNVQQVIASVTIPDPGFAYYICASAGFLVHKTTTDLHAMEFSSSINVAVNSTTSLGAGAPGAIGSKWFDLIKDDGTIASMDLSMRPSSGTWTGSNTVNLILGSGSNGPLSIGPLSTDLSWHFDVEIMPA